MPISSFMSDVLAFTTASASIKSADKLAKEFTFLLEKHSFHSSIMSGLKRSGENIGNQVILNNWKSEWTERYIEQNYFQVDPVSQYALVADTPFTWSSIQEAHQPRSKSARAHAAALNREASSLFMNDGITIPLRDNKLGKCVISLATDMSMAQQTEMVASAYLAASYFNLALGRLNDKKPGSLVHLSNREIEILTWIASGKTSWETSVILNISERTVHVHLSAIRAKLNVATTTQAVATSLLTGQINL